MYIGIFTQENGIEVKKFIIQEDAYVWMYGKMMRSLRFDCDCMNCLEAVEGHIRFLGGGTFVVEDDDSVMGEGVIGNKEITYDAVYGRSFAAKIINVECL